MKKLNNQQYADFWRNVHSKTKDDLAVVCFPDKSAYFNRFFDRIQRYALTKYLKRECIDLDGKKVLDVGCGRGRWLSFFEKNYGAIATGIDLSEDAIKVCASKGLRAYKGSIIQMPFRDDHFDYISSITVLLHLPCDLKEKAVSEIARVLKQGGKIILIESTWKDPSPHVYGLSISDWEEVFVKYNMKLVHKSGHCFNLFRRSLPVSTPVRDFISIYMDYPLEYVLMNYFYGKLSNMALQHLMVFER